MLFRIGICDDSREVREEIGEILCSHLEKHNIEYTIKEWENGEKLKNELGAGEEIDLLFLDIELVTASGLELAKFIRNNLNNRTMQIVFVSYHSAYAMELFKVQPLDFILKPIKEEQIISCLDLMLKYLKEKNQDFYFQNGQKRFVIPYKNVVYFESEGRKINVVTTKGKYSFYGKLKCIREELPDYFITIHKSFVVNRFFASKFTYEKVILSTGEEFDISKSNRKQVREIILRGFK